MEREPDERIARKSRPLPVSDAERRAIEDLARRLHRIESPQAQRPANDDGADAAAPEERWASCIQDAAGQIAALRVRVDEILFYKWDPLRFSNSNLPRDEYASYVPEVFRLALEHASPDAIADHLTHVGTKRMGMPGDRPRDLEVARLIRAIVHGDDHLPDHEVVDLD